MFLNAAERDTELVRDKLTLTRKCCALIVSEHACNVYKMSGRSVRVYTDTSASHEYLCTLIQNGHEFCKLLIKLHLKNKC